MYHVDNRQEVEAENSVLSDSRIVKLLEMIAGSEAAAIEPVFAPRSDGWVAYPEVEEQLGIDVYCATRLLGDLHRLGYLRREFHDKIQFCPACNSQDLKLVSLCPNCHSRFLLRRRLVEHKSCGYTGSEDEFARNGVYACPKCRVELVLAGADYENKGIRYVCGDCNATVEQPDEEWACSSCRRSFGKMDLREEVLYRYRVNEAQVARLRVERIPKSRVRDFLAREGYDIQETVRTTGKSGAEHEIDLLGTKRAGPLEHRIVVGFATAEETVESEEVIKLYAKAYDVNAQDIIMVASPRLSDDAMSFARHYHIRVFDSEQLNRSDIDIRV